MSKDWKKDFDKEFIHKEGNDIAIYGHGEEAINDLKDFIAKQRTQIFKEVREKVTELKQEFDDSAWISLKRYVRELLKELEEGKE